MKAGHTRCPLCKRPVQLTTNGFMKLHYSSPSKVGAGFRSLAQKCGGSKKRPEELN